MMVAFAVLRLGLSPDAFWTLPACEWRALVAAVTPQAMSRDGLSELMQTYGGNNA